MNLTNDMASLIMDYMDVAAVTDASGRYKYVNKCWSEIMGISLEEATRMTLTQVVPESGAIETLRTGKPVSLYTISRPDKTDLVYFCSSLPIYDGGEFCGVVIWSRLSGLALAKNLTMLAEKVSTLSAGLDEMHVKVRRLSNANYGINNIIGQSPLIRRLKDEIIAASRTKSTVLIEGETGTGKEMIAHAIHDLSSRSSQRLVRVNCSAIPSDLMESEFFGYTEGAFTGAKKTGKPGKFELANHGTLFLDEINQLPLHLQPKLLRPLQESEVERIGDKQPVPIDVRVIAASNVPLAPLMSQGLFRSDLYYRVNVVPIKAPALRDRKEDIPLLVDNFLSVLNPQLNTTISRIDGPAMDLLQSYDWPGNVRELHNVIESALNRSFGEDTLMPEHISRSLTQRPQSAPSILHPPSNMDFSIRREDLSRVLSQYRGNKTAAAEELKISRTTLYKLLRKHNLYH